MEEEIGKAAGAIWKALSTKGELSLSQLKKARKGKRPISDWAAGWLAREDKIVIASEKRLFRVRLKEAKASAAFAS